MAQYEVEITRRFYVTETVIIEAENPDRAETLAYLNEKDMLKKLPTEVYEHLNFEEMEVNVELSELSAVNIEALETALKEKGFNVYDVTDEQIGFMNTHGQAFRYSSLGILEHMVQTPGTHWDPPEYNERNLEFTNTIAGIIEATEYERGYAYIEEGC